MRTRPRLAGGHRVVPYFDLDADEDAAAAMGQDADALERSLDEFEDRRLDVAA